ncbi:hypothetical protein LEP1GSC034_2571 [Leptospira interrogans str. 2003000735]|uniref:Uncharacterized protein n=2 Tax=Leptospira interrogans TaxID=173 RepID=A0A829D649_LEPIR|nr:hypothetical protein [Leptospira interrogans]EMY04369.1 hypothetical protein LEP1GSC029_1556 [Leptospira interrogans str. 2002000626]EMY27370.1 hypothetical protein LEP1GSC115_0260 [Leptospira interrogans serovar Australis str. 200703203]EKN90454.1 hypothetical protein LEP1GSC027_1751 [Leptospira interrogans str. 2002000624]EKQ40107.1 hypothetical protein LEP1GSC025_2120 [Leptospira interrogans str. 2002000621]EKQ45966.1 hypothetical protein LEP1GSC026_2571 [Leptospira interrogans str. 2002
MFLKKVRFVFSLLFVLVLLQSHLNAGTLSFREKKKSIEKKIRILEESRKSIPFQNQEENWNRLTSLKNRFQNSVYSESLREKEKSMLLLERALFRTASDFTLEGKVWAKNLIRLYSDEFSEKEKSQEVSMTTFQKERAATYFRMAKEELDQAEKFDRDGNNFYALILYGRSIQYSLSAFQTMNFGIPNQYIRVLKKKPIKAL